MRKGITPVIAMILLILIVVALGGVFAAWTTRTWESLGESGEQQVDAVTGTLSKSITIDNVDCATGTIYVRNVGSTNITADEVSTYVDNSLIPHGETGLILTGAIEDLVVGGVSSGSQVKVTVSGNSATYRC